MLFILVIKKFWNEFDTKIFNQSENRNYNYLITFLYDVFTI